MNTSPEILTTALQLENERFNERYLWFVKSMPEGFFNEVDQVNLMLIVHNIMEFQAQDYFSIIELKHAAIVIHLDDPDGDLKVLDHFSKYGIQSYQTYVSQTIPPFLNAKTNIRIVVMHFYGYEEGKPLSAESKQQLRELVKKHNHSISDHDFERAMDGITSSFLHSLPLEKIALAICMYYRATTRDKCQYEVHYDEDWESKKSGSMKIILAWRNTPRHNFLYRLARVVHRHGLIVKGMSVSYNHLYLPNSILVVMLELHGGNDKPVWERANILDFVKELITVKYFASFDRIDNDLVTPGVISGNMGNLLRAMSNWIHQALVHLDVNLYTLDHVIEGLCRHPELTADICEAFKYKFDPDLFDEELYLKISDSFFNNIEKLDTGHEENDIRRRNILKQGMNFVKFTLKTNFYRPNYSSLSFRVDPHYIEQIPFNSVEKFPELPYGIIFVKGMHFFGFHIRFRDLARGGLRTVFPEYTERMLIERNNVFTECYNLAYTQQMKNKDIPEGGAKGIIFLRPHDRLESETSVLKQELQTKLKDAQEVEKKIEEFRKEERMENLYQAQRSFIESLITIVNCDAKGNLRVKDIIDYWGKPEYLYLGPDENLHDNMIQWIADYSKKSHYKPGSSFISGKPKLGINHKEYGVTSLGVNVYLDAILHYLKIDPLKQPFTVKMSGGPDGDVAGNEINNLFNFYPETAKLIALTDVSGTIFDPIGLDLQELVSLFHQGQSIRNYPPDKLHEGGFLLDKFTKRSEAHLMQDTLCWRKREGKLIEDWLSSSEMNYLVRHNVHHVPADIFIPAGGRPRTLNEWNYKDFLDETGKPTARAIVEGANLYLTPGARIALEDLGVLIIKDSSANKTGVICSSFEVLCGLTLGDQQFLENKQILIAEIKERLHQCAANEAALLLRTHAETGDKLTEISNLISVHINLFTDQILKGLENRTLAQDPHDPLIRCFLSYCLPTLRQKYQKQLLAEIPELHKKAIIACHIAAQLVYKRGLSWYPSIVDILPLLIEEESELST